MKRNIFLVVFAALALLLAACGPAPVGNEMEEPLTQEPLGEEPLGGEPLATVAGTEMVEGEATSEATSEAVLPETGAIDAGRVSILLDGRSACLRSHAGWQRW